MIQSAYDRAKERFSEIGVDTEAALSQIEKFSLSLHCWQGDDVGGFEKPDSELGGGGIQVTGNYPGKARTIEQLRKDYEKVFSLLPGKHRANLHAIYGDFGGKLFDRNQILPEHFQSWIDWAKSQGVKLDFNPTLFSHPKADDGFTLSSKDPEIRKFWIDHCIKSREIASYMGKSLGSPSVCNLWIPDGTKDTPVSRFEHRSILLKSLDEVFTPKFDKTTLRDAVEGKLFGIGSESFVTGSHDFYLSYAISNPDVMLCMDMGHFHPTESVADKISAVLPFQEEILLHVSRGVRWDSDHVVIFNDELRNLANEVVRAQALNRVHVALDFFDASINRIGAWVTGSRATIKAMLYGLLEPIEILREAENAGNNFKRLALLDEMKSMPFGDVWNFYCMKSSVPAGIDWISEILEYEKQVLKSRN